MDDLLALARQQLERAKVLCAQVGLKHVDLPPEFVGVGIAIGFTATEYVVLSVMGGGNENQLMITSGIVTDIKRDRLAALEAGNSFTSNNTGYPVFLHDAEIGWALIVQQTYPMKVLLDTPQFFDNCVRSLPQVVIEYRATVRDKWDLQGRPWQWTPEDLKSLLIRSLM